MLWFYWGSCTRTAVTAAVDHRQIVSRQVVRAISRPRSSYIVEYIVHITNVYWGDPVRQMMICLQVPRIEVLRTGHRMIADPANVCATGPWPGWTGASCDVSRDSAFFFCQYNVARARSEFCEVPTVGHSYTLQTMSPLLPNPSTRGDRARQRHDWSQTPALDSALPLLGCCAALFAVLWPWTKSYCGQQLSKRHGG
jgi:hypothetical protein